MKIAWGFEGKEFKKWRNIITIGSFDGIHLGHKAILDSLIQLVPKYKGKTVVITFEPLPKDFFGKGNIRVITTLDEKLEIFEGYGVDGVCIIPFTETFSKIKPLDFLNKLWINFQPYAITVGYNHHFGRDGKGGISLLEEFSRKKSTTLVKVPEVKVRGETISSSKIRSFINKGEIIKANEMLGRKFFFTATVNRGEAIGRTLSYPTANLDIVSHKKILPKKGVYAAEVLMNSKSYGAMLYLGRKPTFYEDSDFTCEVHIMGFRGNLYGRELTVKVLEMIRDERKFRSAENLKNQIMNDEETAKKIISSSALKEGG